MTDRHAGGAPGASGSAGDPVDHEINFRGIRIFVLGLSAVSLVVLALMWGIVTFFKSSLVKEDPAPPKLEEARATREPPGPNLQPNPSADLAALRAAEDLELSKWAWVDKNKGVARVPVDRAIEIVLSRGFPAPPPMPPPAPSTAPGVEAPR